MDDKNRKQKKGHYWSDGLSIDETRFSVIILMSVIGFFYALFSHYRTGDITGNLLNLVEVLIYSIVGINVANTVSQVFQNRREKQNPSNYNNYDESDDSERREV